MATLDVVGPTMAESVVCFLDVLGSQAAMEGPDAAQKLVDLKQALSRAAERMEYTLGESEDVRILWFTDNVLLVWEVDPSDDGEFELGTMFVTAAWFMLEMALAGFFVRGAVTIGEMYVDDRFAFGPALAAAVRLEHSLAVHPRTVLSTDAYQLAHAHAYGSYANPEESPQASEVVLDRHGVPFLNYLAMLEEDEDPTLQLNALLQHRQRIEAAIQDATGRRVIDKLQWLGRYHNHYCSRTWASVTDLLLDEGLLDETFRGLAEPAQSNGTLGDNDEEH